MKKLLSVLSLALLICTSQASRAAVTQIKYKLVYNSTTCRYDMLMIIAAGSATAGNEKKTYTAQISIVVPSGSTVATTIVPNYPRTAQVGSGGNTLTGSGVAWTVANFQQGSATFGLNGSDVYSFTSPTSQTFYPNMATGDTLRLFSFDISTAGITACNSGVRLWRNNLIQAGPLTGLADPAGGDPTSLQFNNKDFNNGHDFYSVSAGTTVQTYSGNAAGTTTLPAPTITSISPVCPGTLTGFTINNTASPCASATYSYSFAGPFTGSLISGTSASASLALTLPSPAVGTYTATITNSNGCVATATRTISTVNCLILPIALTNWVVTANHCAANMTWSAPTAEAFERFEVQYSRDGKQFTTVGRVARDQYNDKYAFNYDQVSGKGYYRLKVIDLQGKETYSDVRSIVTDCDANEITISPNPTSSTSVVNGLTEGDQVKVTDMLGNVLANYISGGAKATIELEYLPAGVYSVMVTRNGEILKAAKLTKL